jgi:cell division transport system permease protein
MMAKVKQKQPEKSFSEKISAYFIEHLRVLFASLGRIVRTPFTSFMTVLVLAVTLTLAGGFYLLVKNIQQLSGNLDTSYQLSVFLTPEASDQQGRALAKSVEKLDSVASVTVIDKAQAMQEFKHYSGFGEALKALDHNPLPVVIQVMPTDAASNEQAIKQLIDRLEAFPRVDFVQLDMMWLKRLQSILQLLGRGVMVLNALLAIAVLFITGNTIRLELQNRRDEVLIAKLVGATHAFVQRPFIYTGFWLGLFAGLLAWILISIILWFLSGPVETIAALYAGQFQLLFLSVTETLMLWFLAALLGVLGAWGVLHYQLRQIRPA